MFKKIDAAYSGKTLKQKVIASIFLLFTVLLASFACTVFVVSSGIWGSFAPNESEGVFGMFLTIFGGVVIARILFIEYKE
jgi:hypothetical protein